MKNRLLYILTALLLLTGTAGCIDEIFTDEPVGEGEARISVELTFSPVTGTYPASRANGNDIQHIDNFCLFIYNEAEDELIRRVTYAEIKEMGLTWSDNTAMPSDYIPAEDSPYHNVAGENTAHQAEETTPKASFTLDRLPYGKYRIYVVANMNDLMEEPYNYTDEQLNNAENLKKIPLDWQKSDIPANNQMFGYFTLQDKQKSEGFEAPSLTINKPQMALHSWIKRAASKVTVLVDGSELYPGVQVWIKSIQVKDIPDMCFLGKDNTSPAHLIEQGQKLDIDEAEGAGADDAFNVVTDELSYPRSAEAAHAQNSPQSLFFYENMQGEGQLKTQVWPAVQGPNPETPMYPDGNNPISDGYKDSKIAGTYVEVIGYYKNDGKPYAGQDPNYPKDGASEGLIIYRFMLGKNVTTNYDAQRNHHFKLTLKLKHNANNNDWHIVYNQEPEILAREPYYISYLYNQTMNYPIKIVGGELISLRAEIPVDETTKSSWAPRNGEVTDADIAAAAALGGKVYWPTNDVNDPGPWNGFLSLRKTSVAQFGVWPSTNPDGSKDDTYNPNAGVTYTYNKTYYEENNRGWRVYDVSPTGKHADAVDGDYSIERSGNEYNIEIPLFTRARVMVSQTAYSGNNPYAAYNRESKVKIIAEIKKSSGEIVEVSKVFTIIQGRRVLNPKAIWREASNPEKFHVQLKILPYQQAPKFENLVSDGTWRVEVDDNCKSWVQIYPTENESQFNPDGSITGVRDPFGDDNIIDFWYKPASTTTETRGGIIRVYYNNNTCVHTIFVRQGYDPVSFYGSNVMWHTNNLRTGGYNGTIAEEAADPEVEGAYFRRYNRQYPIDARSNTLDQFHKNGMTRDFLIAKSGTATETMKWDDIRTTDTSWGTFKVNVNGKIIENCRLPKPEDWENIVGTTENPRLSTVYGFGVLYGDDAEETLEDVNLVYGATPDNHNSGRGMRGVIVCDESTGTQIFLPIAASGYGRFKQYSSMDRYNRLPAGQGGVIQYANRYTWYPSTKNTLGVTEYPVQYHPLFYDLWMSEGTYYWFEGPKALDINFYTLDMAVSEENENGLGLVWGPGTEWAGGPDPSGSDAVHIRLVHDE